MYHVWIVSLSEGKKATMLTDQCPDKESAIKGAVERFGRKRVLSVCSRNENNPPLAPKGAEIIKCHTQEKEITNPFMVI